MARWTSCNILNVAPDANRLWQFQARGGFKLKNEAQAAVGKQLPSHLVAKSWKSLWQPVLNVAWLPLEQVFLRVVELPKSAPEETQPMVELLLEKISPLPVTQIAWTLHVLPSPAKPAMPVAEGEARPEELQTVIVIIVERSVVEEFLGKLEGAGYLADRLEAPMLDQLAMATPAADGAWIYPVSFAGQSAALVAFWNKGALRNLSYVVLPPDVDRAKKLKEQLGQFVWAGELEGWLADEPQWHLVADPVNAAEWEGWLRAALDKPVSVATPLPPVELAARTARRATAANAGASLLPPEFSARYRQQFIDRLWLRGLLAAGIVYAIYVLIYLAAVQVLNYQTVKVEQQVASLGGSYTNALQLKARGDVLKERQQLKYAALDCWKLVADQLPPGILLQRFSFSDGSTLALNGTCTPDQVELISDQGGFYDNVRKLQVNGQPVFKPNAGDQLLLRQTANTVTWNFSLELQHVEARP